MVKQSTNTGLPDPEEEGTMILQNVTNYKPSHTESQHRRLESSAVRMSESQNFSLLILVQKTKARNLLPACILLKELFLQPIL